mmetsp:Transcript_42068/g.91689  ORF Transcript_42068/g.91689 Transcript_42068/m.91689 type:complete len:219 (+) Transcript_42068:85-741(+)
MERGNKCSYPSMICTGPKVPSLDMARPPCGKNAYAFSEAQDKVLQYCIPPSLGKDLLVALGKFQRIFSKQRVHSVTTKCPRRERQKATRSSLSHYSARISTRLAMHSSDIVCSALRCSEPFPMRKTCAFQAKGKWSCTTMRCQGIASRPRRAPPGNLQLPSAEVRHSLSSFSADSAGSSQLSVLNGSSSGLPIVCSRGSESSARRLSTTTCTSSHSGS